MSEIKGTSRVFKKLKMVSKQVDLQVKSAIQRNTEQMLNEARKNVPIDTGELQRSGDKDTSNPYIGKVFFGAPAAPYAPYVEFGTGGMVAIIPGFEGYASQFKRGPGHNMKAQPFLIPAFILYKKIFLKDMRKIAKNISK
jgi:HK97 gp10 family phage protein